MTKNRMKAMIGLSAGFKTFLYQKSSIRLSVRPSVHPSIHNALFLKSFKLKYALDDRE